MKNMIIGTAGHIDHGKTTLIKALTGTDTDRLEEEHRRGITIDLGFAYLDMPDGARAGIIDVPGHERFVKNMLAGVGGIDLVIMVIAADEGIMPQTREHLDILSILDIKHGLIALTKTDMVDGEWVKLVSYELKTTLEGSFLENAPIIPVSAVKGEGLADLKEKIYNVYAEIEQKKISSPARLPVDRAFVLEGIGTVITGTLTEGTINVGGSYTIYPAGSEAKVRSIQTHGKSVQSAYAGQRTAINLSGVKKSDIDRGFVLADTGSMHTTSLVDAKLHMLDGGERNLKNRDRIRFHHGTTEVMGRVILLDDELLEPGGEGLVQIFLEDDVALKAKDHFVIRSFSPVDTMGGGIIIDASPTKHKRFRDAVIENLISIEAGGSSGALEAAVQSKSADFMKLSDIARPLNIEENELEAEYTTLIGEGALISLSGEEDPDPVLIHISFLDRYISDAAEILQEYHKKNPLKQGMSKEEFRNKIISSLKITKKAGDIRNQLKAIEDMLVDQKVIEDMTSHVKLYGRKISLDPTQEKVRSRISEIYQQQGLMPGSNFENLKNFAKPGQANAMLEMMVSEGELTKLSPEVTINSIVLAEATEKISEYIKKNEKITLAQCRDLFQFSRKFALLLLDYLDKIKITVKIDDYRVLK